MITDCDAVEALAEAWASIDGKAEEFRHGKEHPTSERAQREMHYEGYIEDAKELLRRIEKRGYHLVGRKPTSEVDC